MKKALLVLLMIFSTSLIFSQDTTKSIILNDIEITGVRTDTKTPISQKTLTKDDISKTFNNYSRTIEFQIFDEGKYTIPPLEFSINGEILKTIPYEITVYNPVNADEQISDIMNNKQVELGWKDYWEMYKWYVLGTFIVLALLFVFLGMFKNGVFGKNNKEKPSIHKTLLDLKNLEKKKYAENGNFRMFYVELIDITRDFLTKQYRIPADVLLTDDLIDLMKHTNKISTENEKVVEEIFLRGDLVKFAKTFPTKELMQKDFGEIYDFVERSTVDIEAEHLREVN